MKIIYIGPDSRGESFYTVKSEDNIRGFSKTIEVGDILTTDPPNEFKNGYLVTGLTKRNYNGVSLNQEDAKNNFFDATVKRMAVNEVDNIARSEEGRELLKNMKTQ